MANPTPIGAPQPPCARCGHRRIFHFIPWLNRSRNGRKIIEGEVATACSVDTDNPERTPCGCDGYVPAGVAHAR